MDDGASSYRRFLDGDKDAFDLILRLYRDSLTFFIYSIVCDADAAQDLAVDTFMELIVNPGRYNFSSSLKTYLYMIGRSRAIDYIRHRNAIAFTELTGSERDDSYLPENVYLQNETQREVKEAVEALPEDMRTAVILVYFEDMSYEEVAGIMKKSRKQVDNLLYRAKKALRSSLGREGELK